MRQVFMVVLQPPEPHWTRDGHASAYCKNWRQVRKLLRTDYKGAVVKIYRQKWALPYADFWGK
jgi:hypothetical protein